MLKSTFSKYLVAFIAIILVSFLLLSGIITSMIRSYATSEKENQLMKITSTIVDHLEDESIENLETYVDTNLPSYVITPLINRDEELDVLILNKDKKIILSTIDATPDEDGLRRPAIGMEFGNVNLDSFTKTKAENGEEILVHKGKLNGLLSDSSIVYAHEVFVNSETRGYVISLYSTEKEDRLIAITRRTVINSSAWVMLAAVIAVYFITDRIIRPLKNMTAAAKKFGKGDFSTRVTVYGNDEVAALGNAFNNMADSLENLEKMRSSFLASVSHDLRTPMTTIAGFIDGMMSGAIPPDKQDQYLQIISSEVHRLSRLVSQLLDISRLESGDRKMSFENFDIVEVARIVLISFEHKIEDKNLDVEFLADDEDGMNVYADKDGIHQVLYNLCHNAIKFSREGGKLQIKIESKDTKTIKVSVYDEGQSISQSEIGRIFERFYKTDQSRGLDKTGVGLGLYICKTIIDAHDEKIEVSSVENQSCEFSFTLKKAKNQKG